MLNLNRHFILPIVRLDQKTLLLPDLLAVTQHEIKTRTSLFVPSMRLDQKEAPSGELSRVAGRGW